MLAVQALATGDLETCYHSVSLLDIVDSGADIINDTTELVAEDISLFHFHHGAMKKMKVATTDCASGDLENDVAVLDKYGFRYIDCGQLISEVSMWSGQDELLQLTDFDIVLALPDQSLHHDTGIAILVIVESCVGNILDSVRVVSVADSTFGHGCCLCH